MSSHVVLWVRVVAGYDHLQKVSVGIGPVLISVSVSVSGLQSSAPLPHGLPSLLVSGHTTSATISPRSMSLMLVVYSANAGQDFVILRDSDSQVWLGNDFYCPRWCIAERVARHQPAVDILHSVVSW